MVLLTAVVALVTGAVLSFAAGARRTATAPDRYAAVWAQGSDVLVQQETGTPVTEEIQGLDAVRAVDGASFVFGVLRRPGATESIDGILFAGMPGPLRSRLLGGRLPNPDQPNEFVATRSFVDGANLRIGDTLQLLTLTQEQADTSGFNVSSPDGLTLDATLVGILESAAGARRPDTHRPLPNGASRRG